MRSDGSVKLRNCGRQADIARKCGVDRATVSKWMNGDRTPTYPNRKVMLEELGIDLDAWDRPVRNAIQAGPAAA